MVVLVLERGKLATILGMCVQWLLMVVLFSMAGTLSAIPGM
jgi:hypothetical protein